MNTKVQLRRGNQDALDAITLDVGEQGYTTDTKRVYIGDGADNILVSSQWTLEQNNNLSYENGRISSSLAPTGSENLCNKQYVDNLVGMPSMIGDGDSYIKIIDDGTGTVSISADSTRVADFNSNGLQLQNGIRIDEISDDTDLSNSSSTTVCTENAIKTYIDNISKIHHGNTGIEIFDFGTGTIAISADGNVVADFQAEGLQLENGTRIKEFSTDNALGTSDSIVSTQKATKQFIDNTVRVGRETLTLNDTNKSVTFSTAFSDTNYTLSVLLTNTTDTPPAIYSYVITTKSVSGFGVDFSGSIDSNNYELEWLARHDT